MKKLKLAFPRVRLQDATVESFIKVDPKIGVPSRSYYSISQE